MIFDFRGFFDTEPDIWEFMSEQGGSPTPEEIAHMLTRETIVVSVSSSGSNELVAAQAGVVVRVFGFFLSAAGAVTAQFKSAATSLTGAMTMSTGVPLGAAAPYRHLGAILFQTAPGEALNLVLGGAVAVGGFAIIERESQTP